MPDFDRSVGLLNDAIDAANGTDAEESPAERVPDAMLPAGEAEGR